jgi:hypothetical protein
MNITIKPREREAILQSLRAGVVPRIGLRHIQVGRKDEVSAVLQDLERMQHGAAAVRFIIGRFGSGKSFFLNLTRMVALEQRFVVAQADITPDRRLHATGGSARSLYAELIRNLAVRSKPDGGALAGIVERWVADVDHQVRTSGGGDAELTREIHTRLKPLQEFVSGYDFATVIAKYVEGFQSQNEALMASALRWLRAEYGTKTEARQDLGVRSIIDDADVYDYLKLMAAFVRLAGYSGLLVNLDEMGVLSHRLNHAQARNANYEMILRMVNDCLQGSVEGLGFYFAGTDAFLEDRRRGLYSYEALATRLADNRFAANGLRDLSGPVIRLSNLSPEDLYVLLHNIRLVFAGGDPSRYLLGDDGLVAFLNHCARTLGADYFRTPRDAVKAFVGFLSVLEQNPGTDALALLGTIHVETSPDPETELHAADGEVADPGDAGIPGGPAIPPPSDGEDDLTTFRL